MVEWGERRFRDWLPDLPGVRAWEMHDASLGASFGRVSLVFVIALAGFASTEQRRDLLSNRTRSRTRLARDRTRANDAGQNHRVCVERRSSLWLCRTTSVV